MRQYILHGGLHRIGSRPNHIFDNERFLGLDPYDMLWMTKKQTPMTNVITHDKAYELKIALPGFKKEEIELAMNGNVLTLSAEKKVQPTEQATVLRDEFNRQYDRRLFCLPDNVDSDTIHASFKDGILHIRILYQSANPYRIIPIE